MPTLGSGPQLIRLIEVINPSTQRRLVGEGLPFPKDTTRRGDLIVKFDIKFPESLNEPTRQFLYEHLPAK